MVLSLQWHPLVPSVRLVQSDQKVPLRRRDRLHPMLLLLPMLQFPLSFLHQTQKAP